MSGPADASRGRSNGRLEKVPGKERVPRSRPSALQKPETQSSTRAGAWCRPGGAALLSCASSPRRRPGFIPAARTRPPAPGSPRHRRLTQGVRSFQARPQDHLSPNSRPATTTRASWFQSHRPRACGDIAVTGDCPGAHRQLQWHPALANAKGPAQFGREHVCAPQEHTSAGGRERLAPAAGTTASRSLGDSGERARMSLAGTGCGWGRHLGREQYVPAPPNRRVATGLALSVRWEGR